MHIPISEYMTLYNLNTIYGAKNEPVSCGSINTGLMGAMLE